MMNNNDNIKEFIKRRRRQLLVHRVLYYIYNTNHISDFTYDQWNKELLSAETEYPDLAAQVEFNDISPTKIVGSSNINDYPIGIVRTAQSLIKYKAERGGV